MKKYFLYRLKKNLPLFAVMTAAAIVIYVLPLLTDNYDYWNKIVTGAVQRPEYYYLPSVYTSNILAALALFCIVVPFFQFGYKMSPRSADMYYSLPITRTKLFFVQFAVGFITIIAAYSGVYLIGFAVAAARVKGLNLIWYLWGYLASFIPAYCIYALTTFIVTRANTTTDAVIMVILSHFALVLVMGTACRFNDEWFGIIQEGNFAFSWPLVGTVGEHALGNVLKNSYWYMDAGDICELVAGIIITLLAAGVTAGCFLTEKNAKAENCGQITESLFGYKMLIPLYYILSGISVITSIEDIWGIAIFALCAFIGLAIWRRSIKIGKPYAILLAVCTVIIIAVVFIVN